MSNTAPARFECARCGLTAPASALLLSKHTELRYCRNVTRCSARARRRKKTAETVTA